MNWKKIMWVVLLIVLFSLFYVGYQWSCNFNLEQFIHQILEFIKNS